MTDPVPTDSIPTTNRIPEPPSGHAVFYADVQHVQTAISLTGIDSTTVKAFDGIIDKITYKDNYTVMVQFGSAADDGTIAYGAPTLLSTREHAADAACLDVDGDSKSDVYAFGPANEKVYLIADTSQTMADLSILKGVEVQDGQLSADINADGLTDVVVAATDATPKTALETLCQEQLRYCMITGGVAHAILRGIIGPSVSECYTTPRDKGIGTVYIEQQWVE